ncbi:MAG TPA: hypothetical protein VEQ85_07770, partial [Lacipirellulaceae bacterium]|nr:hypothetical protein [Lacipirellulaceae bacterium]
MTAYSSPAGRRPSARTARFCAGALACLAIALAGSPASAATLEERVAALRGSLTKNPAGKIVDINLEDSAATVADVQLIAQGADLVSLRLWGADIKDDAVDLLVKLPKLADLSLINAAITDAGLAKLKQIKTLRQLNLQGSTELTNEGMATIAQLGELTHLSLAYTAINDPGVAALAPLKKLKLLDVRGCLITDAGLAIVGELPALVAIKCRSSAITDAGLAHLAGAKKLRGLHLEDAKLSDGGM